MSLLDTLNKSIKGDSRLYWQLREWYVVLTCLLAKRTDSPCSNKRPRLLFYHVKSLGHAGTEKFLQILARHLNKDAYDVYFMYPDHLDEHPDFAERLAYVTSGGVTMLPFNYKSVDKTPPYIVRGMNTPIEKVIDGLNIDVFITATIGCANYPFSTLKKIPIILLNIFGQPNVQKNVSHHICISKEVADKISPIVPTEKIKILPVPSEGPTRAAKAGGLVLRKKYSIPDTDIVFGRIGRNDNNIHDPIAIEAFRLALKTNPNIHYLIMSPPPILVQHVKKENIPNVYFIPPSGAEEDVWAFHAAIDVLAHFRNDGESFGLNIAESMLSGNPIISHRSHIWNAHLEYLDESFSRIAEKDDVDSYASYMLEFAKLHKQGALKALGEKAAITGDTMFHIKNNIMQFEEYVTQAVT